MGKNIVILTGAGISAESGLETFRSSDGLWANHPIEEVATFEAYQNNPEKVQTFYNQRRAQLKEVKPNEAHHALCALEKNWPGDFTLVTQNVDDLHGRAGSKNLIHMHGELYKARCTETNETIQWEEDLSPKTTSPFHPEGLLRPHIVWFGEIPLQMDVITQKLNQADIFVSIGTSGNVYPASGFAQQAYMNGASERIEINVTSSEISHMFTKRLEGKATVKVPELVENLLHA